MGLKRTGVSAWLACQRCHALTLAHLDAYKLFTNLLAPLSDTSGLSYTAAYRPGLVPSLSCWIVFPRNSVCSASFAFSCTSQLFIPSSRCCLQTCPNALNQRITHKCDLSLPFPLFSPSLLSFSLSLSVSHPLIHTYIYSQPSMHKTQTPTNKCAHT